MAIKVKVAYNGRRVQSVVYICFLIDKAHSKDCKCQQKTYYLLCDVFEAATRIHINKENTIVIEFETTTIGKFMLIRECVFFTVMK